MAGRLVSGKSRTGAAGFQVAEWSSPSSDRQQPIETDDLEDSSRLRSRRPEDDLAAAGLQLLVGDDELVQSGGVDERQGGQVDDHGGAGLVEGFEAWRRWP